MKYFSCSFLFIASVLVILLSACQPDEATMMILPEDASMYDQPAARGTALVIALAAGDTVYAFGTRNITIPGSGREDWNYATWYHVRNGMFTGWLPAQAVALAGDPRLDKIIALKELPPSPTLYRKRTRTAKLRGWARFEQWCGTTWRRNFGTYEQIMEIELREACDFESPEVRAYAHGLIPLRDEGVFHLSQACNLWDDLHEKWVYINDPQGSEYIASASESIRDTLKGDCEDHYILLAALIRAIGGEAHLHAIQTDRGGHVFAELRLGDEETMEAAKTYLMARYHQEEIEGIRNDGHGNYFLNLDWVADHVGAGYYDHEPILTVIP